MWASDPNSHACVFRLSQIFLISRCFECQSSATGFCLKLLQELKCITHCYIQRKNFGEFLSVPVHLSHSCSMFHLSCSHRKKWSGLCLTESDSHLESSKHMRLHEVIREWSLITAAKVIYSTNYSRWLQREILRSRQFLETLLDRIPRLRWQMMLSFVCG
jgi:hypothetical protein